MDPSEAFRVLGVGPGASAEEVRAAYLRRVRSVHPDVAAAHPPERHTPAPGEGGSSSLARTVEVIEAYRVASTALRGARGASVAAGGTDALVTTDGDTLVMRLPPEEAFLAVLDAASDVGDVTYVDPELGLVETLVLLGDGSRCSLVVMFGRAVEAETEALCTVEPPAEGVVDRLAACIRVFLG